MMGSSPTPHLRSSTMELRSHPRFDVRWPVTIRVSPDSYVRAEALNIGPGGLGLGLTRRAVLPKHVMLMLGTAIGPILGQGTVRWERPVWKDGLEVITGLVFEPHAGFSSVRFELALEKLRRGELVGPQELGGPPE